MRYLVLLRFGLWDLRAVMRVDRAQDGSVSCSEVLDPRHSATCWPDGRLRATAFTGREVDIHRTPPAELTTPQVVYSIPGSRLIDPRVPPYDGDLAEGATVQMSAYAVLDQPHRMSLALLLVPTGARPEHSELVGDRRIDQGVPDLWVLLTRTPAVPSLRPIALPKRPSNTALSCEGTLVKTVLRGTETVRSAE